MKMRLLPCALFVLISLPAFAEQGPVVVPLSDGTQITIDAARFAAAKQLIDLLDLPGQIMASLDNSRQRLSAVLLRVNPGQKDRIEKVIIDSVKHSTADHMDELVDNAARIYAIDYTTEELQTLIAFYQSPVGKKDLALRAQIEKQSIAINQNVSTAIILDSIKDIVGELKNMNLNVPKEMEL